METVSKLPENTRRQGQIEPIDPRSERPRPRKSVTAKMRAIRHSSEYIEKNEAGEYVRTALPDGLTVGDIMANVAAVNAMNGNVQFFREFLDRTEGKVPTRLANADGKNLPSQVVMVEICLPQPMIQAVVASTVHEIVQSDQGSGSDHEDGQQVAEPAD